MEMGGLPMSQEGIYKAIDKVHLLRDVGDINSEILKVVLPHCTAEQLLIVERETDRDFTPITNKLWMNFYKRKFGEESTNLVISRMKEARKTFKWKHLYQAKMEEQDDVQKRGVKRLTELVLEAKAKKASRQVKVINLAPPASKRKQPQAGRSFGGAAVASAKSSTSIVNKGSLMEKSSKGVQRLQARPTHISIESHQIFLH